MQLNKQLSIKSALAIATTVLLGAQIAKATDVESTLLIYSEKDRVSAGEGAVSIKHELNETQNIKIKLTFDALTGASPNGAAPASSVQTFTRPSGNGSYDIQPGIIPLDDTFKDSRFAVSGTYTRKLSRLNNFFIGANFSGEHDYTSLGVNTGFSRDFNNRNRTISVSVSFTSDKVNPEGGVPIPYDTLALIGESTSRLGPNATKKVYDLLLGVTQTINRNTLFRANYSRSHSTGYLNDPYKFFSVVENSSSANPGEPLTYLYENRPDARNKNSIYTQCRKFLNGNVIDLSYRFFWDDWGINSHTINLFYLFDFKNNTTLEPHIRWYHQSAADFYIPVQIDGSSNQQFTTADYRLSTFSAVTLGLQYSIPMQATHTLKLSFEYYRQFGDSSPPGLIGSLLRYDMFPTLNAVMFRVGYNFSF